MRRSFCLLVLVAATTAQALTVGGSLEAWRKYRDARLQDPALVRLYTFEHAQAGAPIPNLKSAAGALTYEVPKLPDVADQPFQTVPGRWPGKTAVRLDQGRLTGEPFDPPGRAFTVEVWFRKLGPGIQKGNPGAVCGTIVSSGGGYWDAWRVTTWYPGRTINVELGRPQPSSSVGASGTGAVVDGPWHHLAATWDGKVIRLYVDGLLNGSREYDGAYTNSTDPHFRIGFAGYGIGSAILEVDEVAVYSQARSAADILRDAHFEAPLPDALATALLTAGDRFDARDYAGAEAAYATLLKGPDVPKPYRILARLRQAAALRELKRLTDSARLYAAVLEVPELPDAERMQAITGLLGLIGAGAGNALDAGTYGKLATVEELTPPEKRVVRLELAHALRQAGRYPAAREQLTGLLADPELGARQRYDLRLELAHLAYEAGDLKASREACAALIAAADAPPILRALARIRAAESYAREEDFAAAQREYRGLAEQADAPAHLKQEAAERQVELDRISRGLPARDPAASRLKLPARPQPAITLYVAPTGKDGAPGTADRPLATLAGARDAIRALKQRGPLPAGGVTVLVRGGTYPLTAGLELTAADSGTAATPIVYRAADGARPVLTGAVRLTGWRPVSDPAVLAKLDPAVRGKVLEVDLKAAGITEFGGAFTVGNRPDLYYDGRPLTVARYPNTGWLKTGDVLGEPAKEGARKSFTFTYEGDRPSRWADEADPWMYGYWYWDWADGYQKVARFDPAQHAVVGAPPFPGYGLRKGQRFYFANLLSELDAPGEWYLDRARGLLYLDPPADPRRATVELTVLSAPMLTLTDTTDVTFQGLTFEGARNHGVVIKNGERCVLAGCTLRRLGEHGAMIDGGHQDGLIGCDVYTVGRNGTSIRGGDRKTLTPGNHFVENCDIHDFSRVYRTYSPAVWLDGCGNRIAHNLFWDSPHQAMRIEGNDQAIEYNEIHSVCYETDDQGGLDMWWNPSYRGTLIRYNHWHDIRSDVGFGIGGVRLDDAISGVLMYGNVFVRTANQQFGAIQIHGGKDNWVDNNLFYDCTSALSCSPWGDKRWREAMAGADTQRKLHQEVEIDQPPYSTKYPELARLTEDQFLNHVWRNVVYDCSAFILRDPGTLDVADNLLTGQNPGVADAAKGDYRWQRDAKATARSTFRPIPYEEIGLYADPLRASWPVKSMVRAAPK